MYKIILVIVLFIIMTSLSYAELVFSVDLGTNVGNIPATANVTIDEDGQVRVSGNSFSLESARKMEEALSAIDLQRKSISEAQNLILNQMTQSFHRPATIHFDTQSSLSDPFIKKQFEDNLDFNRKIAQNIFYPQFHSDAFKNDFHFDAKEKNDLRALKVYYKAQGELAQQLSANQIYLEKKLTKQIIELRQLYKANLSAGNLDNVTAIAESIAARDSMNLAKSLQAILKTPTLQNDFSLSVAQSFNHAEPRQDDNSVGYLLGKSMYQIGNNSTLIHTSLFNEQGLLKNMGPDEGHKVTLLTETSSPEGQDIRRGLNTHLASEEIINQLCTDIECQKILSASKEARMLYALADRANANNEKANYQEVMKNVDAMTSFIKGFANSLVRNVGVVGASVAVATFAPEIAMGGLIATAAYAVYNHHETWQMMKDWVNTNGQVIMNGASQERGELLGALSAQVAGVLYGGEVAIAAQEALLPAVTRATTRLAVESSLALAETNGILSQEATNGMNKLAFLTPEAAKDIFNTDKAEIAGLLLGGENAASVSLLNGYKKIISEQGEKEFEKAIIATIDSVENVGWTKHEVDNFVAVYGKASAAKIEVDNLADEIAESIGGTVAKAPVKLAERAIQKIANDYNGDSAKIKDLARNTIIVDSDKINNVAMLLKENRASVKVIDSAFDDMGYSGVNASLLTTSGIYAEIQVNTPAMIYAKESEPIARLLLGDEEYNTISIKVGIAGGKGHEFYEKWRVLPAGVEKSTLEKLSKSYYNSIREAVEHGHN